MSCENCQKAQDKGRPYYFRWKKANIALLGCEEHIKEVMEWLRKFYEEKGRKKPHSKLSLREFST